MTAPRIRPAGRRRLAPPVAAALAALAVLLLLAPVPAARADTRLLEFSRDGLTWSSTPQEALFDADLVMAPGASTRATLHLRSLAPSAGVLELALTDVRASGEDAGRAFWVAASATAVASTTGLDAAAGGLSRTRVGDLAERTPVGPRIELAPGQSARLTLTIGFAGVPEGTGARRSSIGLGVSIVFQDARAAAGAGPGRAPAPGASVPWTTDAQVVPAFPAPGDRPGHAEPAGAAAPPTGEGRALLALTGIARSLIIAAVAVTLCGGLLMLLARRRQEDQG